MPLPSEIEPIILPAVTRNMLKLDTFLTLFSKEFKKLEIANCTNQRLEI